MIGTVHLTCAYLKMVGKKMTGSGLSELLLEAGLIGSGSLAGVMSGKHYERSLHCHKIMLEALERLLLQKFLVDQHEDSIFMSLSEIAKTRIEEFPIKPTKNTLDELLEDETVTQYLQKYILFLDKV